MGAVFVRCVGDVLIPINRVEKIIMEDDKEDKVFTVDGHDFRADNILNDLIEIETRRVSER